jgi:hypothetical protein
MAAAAMRNWPIYGPEAPEALTVVITDSDEIPPALLRQSAAAQRRTLAHREPFLCWRMHDQIIQSCILGWQVLTSCLPVLAVGEGVRLNPALI